MFSQTVTFSVTVSPVAPAVAAPVTGIGDAPNGLSPRQRALEG